MTISERLFKIMEYKRISIPELSSMTGISKPTIYDWKKKGTNPGSDKIMVICEALEITPEDLLVGKPEKETENMEMSIYDIESEYIIDGKTMILIKGLNALDESQKNRLIAYMNMLSNSKMKKTEETDRNVEIITDASGKKLVKINDIRFKGKRSVDWSEIKEYLKEYVGSFYEIASSGDAIYIGTDLPDEYTGSNYTYKLKGAVAKAKANASQGIPELIEIAEDKHFKENQGDKHQWNARYGWYRYNSRFALPVYGEQGNVARYNIFHASLLIRHDNNGKMYLYDIIDIKKETSNPLES